MVLTNALAIVVVVAILNGVEMFQNLNRYFREDSDFISEIEGTINGKRFRVDGRGIGFAKTGYKKAKFISLEGELPISWTALSTILGHGLG